jgi:hypothetical protein
MEEESVGISHCSLGGLLSLPIYERFSFSFQIHFLRVVVVTATKEEVTAKLKHMLNRFKTPAVYFLALEETYNC